MRSPWWVALGVCLVFCVTAVVAQPDPRQMSGMPLPDPQLPDGTITVRVIRGQLSNNVPNQVVELHQGDVVATATTDEEGRAQFSTLSGGSVVYAVTELDGERLESQRFAAPGRGGVRVMLVGAGDASVAAEPVDDGFLTFSEESWVQVELAEESVEVYYLLEVRNMASVPVMPPEPLAFDLPSVAQSVSVLGDSAPGTRADGRRVELAGPFQPGTTPLRVGYVVPYEGDSLALSQVFPADLEALLLSVEKWGAMDVASTHIARRAEMGPDETGRGTYVLGAGPRLPAGDALAFELTGLPYHNRLPRTIALALALVILGGGAWAAATPATPTEDRRAVLDARKEKLFDELVKVERQHRNGRIGSTKYASRRRQLFASLERVYRELDQDVMAVRLTSSPGVAKGSPVTDHSS